MAEWACIIETDARYGLLAAETDGVWHILGFPSEQAGLEYFEKAYERFHSRGYEASMSACLNWLFFKPSIIRATIEELREMVAKQSVSRIGNVSGSVNVIPLKTSLAKPMWESGSKPALIKEEHADSPR